MGMLDGRTVLITGGSRGQGRAHALVSAREGADIVVFDIADDVPTVAYPGATPADLEETVRQVEALDRRILAITGDVRDQSALDGAVESAIAEFGKVDCLIANAGIWSLAPMWELTDEQWQTMIDVNLTGVWRSVKAVAPHMIERKTGSIVMTSSINGLEPGVNYAHYIAAKHGVVGLMRSAALELGPHGVRCNSVHPGAIDTPMTNNAPMLTMFAGHEDGTAEDYRKAGQGYGILAGSSFLPAEVIANGALFLNSDLAAAVTGVTLPIDAGHMIMPGINLAPVDADFDPTYRG